MTDRIAYLIAKRPEKQGSARQDYYLYDVIYDGEPVVTASRCPECDLARVLRARRISGKVTLLDAVTSTPRLLINIEGAARVTVEENDKQFRFVKWRPFEAKLERLAA
jgi:hypothetical protein